FRGLKNSIIIDVLGKERKMNGLKKRDHFLSGNNLFNHLHRSGAYGNAAIAYKSRRLIRPLMIDKVESIFKRGRKPVIIFEGYKNISIRLIDHLTPLFGVFVLIVLQFWMFRFIQKRQINFF